MDDYRQVVAPYPLEPWGIRLARAVTEAGPRVIRRSSIRRSGVDECTDRCLRMGPVTGDAVFRAIGAATVASRGRFVETELEVTEVFASSRDSEVARALVELWPTRLLSRSVLKRSGSGGGHA